ncbi:microtubule-associated protein tau-like isoform X2 [Vespula squamosa]|uniref:Microtubule-associated protein tau-like isoform X2 n=1 Tax=Vespula squamosa TaxID=30214 RepID=A0ABD2A2M5_VESSQ
MTVRCLCHLSPQRSIPSTLVINPVAYETTQGPSTAYIFTLTYVTQVGLRSTVRALTATVQCIAEQTDEEKTQTRTKSSDLPQPPPSTPTRGRTIKSPSRVITARAVRSSLAKSPTSNKKDVLPKNTNGTTVQNVEKDEEKCKKNTYEKGSPIKESDPFKLSKPSNTPRPPNNLRLKNTDNTSPRKTSPNELRLPKLTASPVHQEVNTVSETHSKLTLPKLIESSMQSTRVAQ